MFPILRQHWTLWAAWTLLSSALLFANPWATFSWPELFACVGALILAIDPRARRETLLAVGLPAIALLCLLDGEGASIARFAINWFVFIGAVLLGARAVDDQRELEAIAGHLALGQDPEQATSNFLVAVEREIDRARRHDRTFVVLSVAPHPRALDAGPPSERLVYRKLAKARWMLELADLLRDELTAMLMCSRLMSASSVPFLSSKTAWSMRSRSASQKSPKGPGVSKSKSAWPVIRKMPGASLT